MSYVWGQYFFFILSVNEITGTDYIDIFQTVREYFYIYFNLW